jgi:hypothetical protein
MSLHPSTDEPTSTKDRKSFWGEPQAVAAVIAAVIGAVSAIGVALIGSGVISVSAGPAIQNSTPSPTAPTTSHSPLPTDASTTQIPSSTEPDVRRSTDSSKPLTLSQAYSADLDTTNPAWDVEYAGNEERFDIEYDHSSLTALSPSDLAIVSGSARYETCRDATGYTEEVDWRKIKPGLGVCVRTSEKRFAFLTVKKLVGDIDNPEAIQLDVTVWDPPFE